MRRVTGNGKVLADISLSFLGQTPLTIPFYYSELITFDFFSPSIYAMQNNVWFLLLLQILVPKALKFYLRLYSDSSSQVCCPWLWRICFTSKFLVPGLITLFVTTLNWTIKLPASPGGTFRVLLSFLTTLVPASDSSVPMVLPSLCWGVSVPWDKHAQLSPQTLSLWATHPCPRHRDQWHIQLPASSASRCPGVCRGHPTQWDVTGLLEELPLNIPHHCIWLYGNLFKIIQKQNKTKNSG